MHGNIFIFETEETLSQDGLNSQSSQTIPEGSICVSCIGTGGIVSITTSKCQTNQQLNSIVLKDKSDLEWAFFSLRNLRETIQMFGSTGTTMTNLSKGKFSSLKILRPNKVIVLDYHALVCPMFEEIKCILQQTKVLIRTRDLLLPRLISGKLSVENLAIQFPPGMEEPAHEL
jgi:type I restriction enzyme S subunit